jgi:hypothetical protein
LATLPATCSEFSSNPAGVSMMLTRGESGINLNKKSKIFCPLGAVSPEPKSAIGPGINSLLVFIIINL